MAITCALLIISRNIIYARTLFDNIWSVFYEIFILLLNNLTWQNGRCDWLSLSVVLKSKRALQKSIFYLTERGKFLCQNGINNPLRCAAAIVVIKYLLNVSFRKLIKPLDFINEEAESERLNSPLSAAQLVCERQCVIMY